MPTAECKGVDDVKYLAFHQLMRERATPLDVRARLGFTERTYYRYLARYKRDQKKAAQGD